MLTVWGRANSVNVQKVLWCCDELGLPYERIDAGMRFGVNTEPAYLAMNPTGRIPTLGDGDFRLWESNAIMRYLALQYGPSPLYPQAPQTRAGIDRWLDWTLSSLQPAERPVFWGYVRTPPDQRDEAALQEAAVALAAQYQLLDHHLDGRAYVEGGAFSLADIALGCFARRWLNITQVTRPPMAKLERWYASLQQRPAFQRTLTGPLS